MESSPSSFVSILPLAGAVLAVSLAYANLKRFRYGDAVEKSAKDSLEKFEKLKEEVLPSAIEVIKHSASYKVLDSLANFQTREIPAEIFKEAKIQIPKILYRTLFLSKADVFISICFAVLAGICISLGSAHPVGFMALPHIFFSNPSNFYCLYWFLFFGFLSPPICVCAGMWLEKECRGLHDSVEADISGMMQVAIKKARIRPR